METRNSLILVTNDSRVDFYSYSREYIFMNTLNHSFFLEDIYQSSPLFGYSIKGINEISDLLFIWYPLHFTIYNVNLFDGIITTRIYQEPILLADDLKLIIKSPHLFIFTAGFYYKLTVSGFPINSYDLNCLKSIESVRK